MEQMRIEKGHRILDVGCGTATLDILIKKAYPDAEVVGIDGDPKILEMARTKIKKEGQNITLDEGMAFEPEDETGFTAAGCGSGFCPLIAKCEKPYVLAS